MDFTVYFRWNSEERSRSSPRSGVWSATASESRAQPAPRLPKPSPGASATRRSTSSGSAGLDGILRPAQRSDARFLHRPEDPREGVILQRLDPAHELGVADGEAEPPAGHSVRLRHAEEL